MRLSYPSKSLRKSRKVFHRLKELLLKKKNQLDTAVYEEIKELLLSLDQAIQNKDKEMAYDLRVRSLQIAGQKIKRTLRDFFREWVWGLGTLLLLVAVINQVWFQLYQIPTGSMRPTFLEKDRLIATKTNFGINIPFKKGHFYFNSDQLKRGNIVILQNDQLPKHENKSRYLFIFPAKKQFVKRLIGKPGDVLYFYGGKIYGIDKNGDEITEFHHSPAFEHLEHIPFNHFEGHVVSEGPTGPNQIHSPVYLYQMNQLIGKLYLSPTGSFQGKFYNGSRWVDESPNMSYQDLWGIKNYGMTRVLSKAQAQVLDASIDSSKAEYFLEISHSPHFNIPQPHLGIDIEGRLRPKLSLEKTYIPLTKQHLEKIKSALNTARFVVKDGVAANYSMGSKFRKGAYNPSFKGVPNGTYEFLGGRLYKISVDGRQTELSSDHPLNDSSPHHIQKLYNLGMQMLTLYDPSQTHYDFPPARYAYFREGGLYLMGHEILNVSDPILQSYIAKERQKTRPFIDSGPPVLADGSLDKNLIRNYGLEIPRGHYLCLGDNHAGSKDCRSWGFIPQENIQGSPAWILWPFNNKSHQGGSICQNKIAWLNGPSLLITSLGLFFFGMTFVMSRREKRKKL